MDFDSVKKLHPEDKTYPKLLLSSFADKAPILFYRGKLNAGVFENTISVVGTRRISDYGSTLVENFVSYLVAKGFVIVSGFMYGVDTLVHKVCVENGGITLAVPGCGVNYVYPKSNSKLYGEILSNGGLYISSFEPEFKGSKWSFVKRNEVVAGLSKAVLVIEGSEKSGALITANHALKFGRKVFAVPGRIYDKYSTGCNFMIKNGAQLVTNPYEIEEELRSNVLISNENAYFKTSGFDKGLNNMEVFTLGKSNNMGKILYQLVAGPKDFDLILSNTGIPLPELTKILSELKLKKLIFEKDMKYYVKNS